MIDGWYGEDDNVLVDNIGCLVYGAGDYDGDGVFSHTPKPIMRRIFDKVKQLFTKK